MARESVNVVQQIAPETTPGTAVPADSRFAGLQFDIGEDLETKQFKRMGAKSNTTSVIHKQMVSGSYSGPMSYVEICYILAGLSPFTVTPGTAPSQDWAFTPNSEGSDPVKSFSLECGDDEAVEIYKYLIIQNLDMSFTLDDMTINGNCFAQPTETGTLNTSGVAELSERPVGAREIDVFMDSTYANIGTTKVTDPFEATFSMGEKFQPKWVLNTDFSSWKENKEMVPDTSLKIQGEHNSQWRTLFGEIGSNPVKFFRVQATGGEIVSGINYLIQLDFCGKIQATQPQRDADGIYAYDFTFGGHQEATMGRAYRWAVRNALAAL